MIAFPEPFPFLLIGNSLFLITLILNQNDSVRDSTSQNSGSSQNPLENVTWFCFFFQLFFLLVKTKFNLY
jgi:hypothetical protein